MTGAVHEKNTEAYESLRKDLEANHLGRVALLNEGKLVDIYDDSGKAYDVGCDKFGLGNFTIQRIGATPISLGIFTINVTGN